MKKSVCMNCNRRTSTCHATCEAYSAEAQANQQRYQERKQQFELNDALGTIFKAMKRNRRPVNSPQRNHMK